MASTADLIQATAGGFTSSSATTISLNAPAMGGSTILMIGQCSVDPAGWTLAGFAQAGPSFIVAPSSRIGFMLRPDVPDSEQSWSLTTLSTMTNWALFEFARSDRVTPLDQYSLGATFTTDAVSTGTTPTTASADDIVIAGHFVTGVSGLSFGGQTNGFVSYAATSQATSPYITMNISLLFVNAIGQYECTATLSPPGSGAAAGGVAYCLRAAGLLPVAPAEVMT